MYNSQTDVTTRLDYSSGETQRSGLTPSIGILLVILIGAALWSQLGGITMDTTVNIAIKIPAWIMFLAGLGTIIAAVFIGRILKDEL